MYTCMYVCMCVRACVRACVCVRVRACACVYVRARVFIFHTCAGYAMPVQYKDSAQAQSIIDSVKQVRTKAGLFDVSHMCRYYIYDIHIHTEHEYTH